MHPAEPWPRWRSFTHSKICFRKNSTLAVDWNGRTLAIDDARASSFS